MFGQGRPHAPNGLPDAALRGHARDRVPLQFPRFQQVPTTPQFPTHNYEHEELWVCKQCASTDCGWDRWRDNWFCLRCGSNELYDANQPATLETEQGVWIYRPHKNGTSASPSPSSSLSSASSMRRGKGHGAQRLPSGDPHDSGDGDEGRAESEAPTNDPLVTPSSASSMGGAGVRDHLSRRQRRAQRAQSHNNPKAAQTDVDEDRQPAGDSSVLRGLRQALRNKSHSDTDSWNSKKGPERGIKWRGGAPPPPPKWTYAKDDLRAFTKFERKVNIWQIQVKPYMSEAESALALYCSLTGEAEEELEHIDIKKLNSKDGVAFLLNQLRGPLQAKEIYLKRKYLSDYETIGRLPAEGIRQYVNRYHRAEKALLSIGIDVGLTYDAESRGSRLLDRAKLSSEQQRMILVGTSQSLSFDDVKNAMLLQYPDHKPAPFLQGHTNNSQRDHGYTGGHRPSKSSGKGKPSQKGGGGTGPSNGPTSGQPFRRTYVTEVPQNEEGADDEYHTVLQAIREEEVDHPDQVDDGDGEEPDDGEEELLPDDDQGDDSIESLMQVLTVTSKKLQAMTQGRKYRGAPRKTIEERKKTSSCSACGQTGHWAGDSECPVSSKGSKAGAKGKSSNDNAGSKGAGVQKVFSVRHSGGHETLYELDAPQPAHDAGQTGDYHSRAHRILVVFQTSEYMCLANVAELQGYCVVDTACQRSCCSSSWHECQRELLSGFGLKMLCARRHEAFQFGAGPPQRSDTCSYFPVAFDASYPMIALSASVLDDISIPFLASLSLLEKLGVVLDLAKHKAYIGLLGCTVDLHLLQGHLCLKISEYPASVASFAWEEQDHHDCEFLCDSALLEPAKTTSTTTAQEPQPGVSVSCDSRDAGSTSNMACVVEAHDGDAAPYGRSGRGANSQDVPHRGWRQDRSDHPGCQAQAQKQDQAQAGDRRAALDMRTHLDQKARQRHGKIRNLQRLPEQVEVGRRWRNPWMALSSVFQVLCAALAVGPDSGGRVMDPSFVVSRTTSGLDAQDTTSADFSNLGVRVPWDDGSCDGDSRLGRGGDGQRERLRLGRGPGLVNGVKKGAMKRLIHNFGKSAQLLEREVKVYEEKPGDLYQHVGADLLEVFWQDRFATKEFAYNLATRAGDFGLSFVNLANHDVHYDSELLLEVCAKVRPHVLVVHNMQRQSAMAKHAVQRCCELQSQNDRLFLISFSCYLHEDPTGVMENIEHLPDTSAVVFQDIKKGTGEAHEFVTNSRCVARAARECGESLDVGATILKAIRLEAQMRCPWKFDNVAHEVWYAPPVDDPERWLKLLEMVEKSLGRSKYFYLSENSKEMLELKQLVPWEITRAQACAQPMTRRLPSDVPFTHRGAALLLHSGKLQLESEDLNEIRQPKLKFEAPVRTAIFFYGMAEDDKAPVAHTDEPQSHVPGLRTDVSFPGIPDSIPKEVRAAVARLHCNAGHPPKQELVRLLAAHGSINSSVLAALDHMKCGTCERARLPLKPRPASVPEFTGQFAEQLQADVFYVRDLSSVNHTLLGVTCMATKLYQAALLPSRDPQAVLNEFDRLWLRPYGYPLFMSVDADGAFEGAFQQHLQESGVVFTVVPADGHHQIGAIERRNSVFRSVLERLIDEHGVSNKDQLDHCMSAAIWAVNSSIHTRGRSSMQAVFGKLPRFPGTSSQTVLPS